MKKIKIKIIRYGVCMILALLWIKNPTGNYEPVIVLIGCLALLVPEFKQLFQSRDNNLFVVTDPKIIQKANHQCITVRFKSNDAAAKFQENKGKLVSYSPSDLVGYVRQDCPILQKYMNSWKFKFFKR